MLNSSWLVNTRVMAKASASLFALVVSTFGCSKGPLCPELGTCGGDPVDKWAQLPHGEETPGAYCQEIMHTPQQEEHLRGHLLPVARQRLPDKLAADWCSELIATSDVNESVKKHNYWWENLPYVGAFLEYKPDGTYRANLTRKAFVDRWYSQTCLRKYGYVGDCRQFESDLERSNMGAGEYNSFKCTDNPKRGGCDCNFEIFEVNTLAGKYTVDGNTITHFPVVPTAHFSQASICVKGDKIEISGKDNSFLWDRPGLRTIEMVRMNCNDGVAGPGELGVDCGLGCPNSCPVAPDPAP